MTWQLDTDDPEQAEIAALIDSNNQRLAILNGRGMMVNLNVLPLILDRLMGTGPERVAFEREVAETWSTVLDQAEAEITKHTLMQGVGQPPVPNGQGLPFGHGANRP